RAATRPHGRSCGCGSSRHPTAVSSCTRSTDGSASTQRAVNSADTVAVSWGPLTPHPAARRRGMAPRGDSPSAATWPFTDVPRAAPWSPPAAIARVRDVPAWLVAALLAAVSLAVAPASADLAAQTYRSNLFAHHGFVLWDDAWYAGHHVLGYRVLFPPAVSVLR